MKLNKIEIVVLQSLADGKEHTGLAICKAAAISMGRTYIVLDNLEKGDLVESRWGDEKPEELVNRGGNRRRYYKLTKMGKKHLEQERGQPTLSPKVPARRA